MSDFPKIYVEGPDDLYSLQAILEVNGVKITEKEGPVTFVPTKSVSKLLDNFEIYLKDAQGRGQPVAFVLDIDVNLTSRWDSIRDKLNKYGVHLNAEDLTEAGLTVQLARGKVGVWLMPDNKAVQGKLEDFLRTLIKPGDPCIDPSIAFVKYIKDNVVGSRFKDKDIEKAEMSAWLSVQDEPGMPYGTAIKARVMNITSPVADLFVRWFKGVFEL